MKVEYRQKNNIVRNGALSPGMVSEKLSDIFSELEMGWAVCDEVKVDYFGYRKEYIRRNPWLLTEYYDKYRIFTNIAADHLYNAKMMLDELIEQIDEVPEVDRENKK